MAFESTYIKKLKNKIQSKQQNNLKFNHFSALTIAEN